MRSAAGDQEVGIFRRPRTVSWAKLSRPASRDGSVAESAHFPVNQTLDSPSLSVGTMSFLEDSARQSRLSGVRRMVAPFRS